MPEQAGRSTIQRRGIIAGVGALVAAALAKVLGPGRAEATHISTGTAGADSIALHVNQTNDATGTTTLNKSAVSVHAA
jgi:hypothetical protein